MPLDVPTASTSPRRSSCGARGIRPSVVSSCSIGRSSAPQAMTTWTPVHDERPYFFQNTKGLRFNRARTARVGCGSWRRDPARTRPAGRARRGRDARSFLRPAAVATGLGAAFLLRRARAHPAVHARCWRFAVCRVLRPVQLARLERRWRAAAGRRLASSRPRRFVGMSGGRASPVASTASARAGPRVGSTLSRLTPADCC